MRRDTYFLDNMPTDIGNEHTCVVGGSGSGKTYSYILPTLLNNVSDEVPYRNFVISVQKASIIKPIEKMYQDANVNVYILDLTDYTKCNVKFDPLHYIKTPDDVTKLVLALIPDPPAHSSADPHWVQAARKYIAAFINLDIYLKGDKATMTDVLRHAHSFQFEGVILEAGINSLSSSFPGNNKNKLFDAVAGLMKKYDTRKEFGEAAIRDWNDYRRTPDKESGSIASEATVNLSNVFSSNIKNMIGSDLHNLDVEKFVNEKSILILHTSPMTPASDAFAKIMFDMLFMQIENIVKKQGSLKIPMNFLFDDFACGTKINDFDKKLSVVREGKVGISILIQSEFQLHSVYGGYAAGCILDNADTYVYLGGNDQVTIDSVSQRVEMPTSDIRRIFKKVLVYQRGQIPYITERYPILEHPLYQKYFTNSVEVDKRKEESCLSNKGGELNTR